MSAVAFPSGVLVGEPLDADATRAVLARFHRDGFAVLPGVLTAEEVALLREKADLWLDHPPRPADVVVHDMGALVLRYTQSLDRVFCDMLVREPLLSLAEAVLGPDCGFVGQNVIRSDQGVAISRWHVDDVLEFPLPDDVPRHDPRIQMPVSWFSFQIALSDIDAPEHGPTEVVRGSHYSGRKPPPPETLKPDDLVFEGQAPEPILCKAGDVYLFNHQLWHRGSPNMSARRRYLMQNQYSQRWRHTRFALPENGCTLPETTLAGAPDRLRRLLGR